MENKNVNLETLSKISTLCRYISNACFEISYAEKHGYVIPEAVQKEKKQSIKSFGVELTKFLEKL